MADVGRPLKFASVEELEQKIAAYFDSCSEEVWVEIEDEEGNSTWNPILDRHGAIKVRQTKPYTVAGLASFLGCDRRTLINYGEREEFFPTIKAAKVKIEAYVEELLLSGVPAAGPIFNLKNNYDWNDKQDVSLNGSMHNTTQDLSSLTPEERTVRINELNRRRGN